MEEEVGKKPRPIWYAPWINHVQIGGMIWTDPVLRTIPKKDGTEFHRLTFLLACWRRGVDKYRKLSINVKLTRAPEYWHSILRRGDPIAVAGELVSQRVKVDWATKPVQFYELNGIVVTRLYPPPPRSGGSRPTENLNAPELDNWTNQDGVDEKG